MGVKERIYEFTKAKKITIRAFEQICNLSNGYVSSMRHSFGTNKLENVLTQFPDLNRNWLLFGDGKMLNDNAQREPDFALLANMSLEKALSILVETNSKLVEENSKLCEENKELRNEVEIFKKALGAQGQAG